MAVRTLRNLPAPLPPPPPPPSLAWSSPSSQIQVFAQKQAYPPLSSPRKTAIRCADGPTKAFKTCKQCKSQFDPSLNHPRACRFHTAHFGGETKRKFESVYTGGTMNTPESGRVIQYWHCCGSEDPFDPGCTAAPHSSYDD